MSVRLYTLDPAIAPPIKYSVTPFCRPKDRQLITKTFPVVKNVTIRNTLTVPNKVPYVIRENLPGPTYYDDGICVKFTQAIITKVG